MATVDVDIYENYIALARNRPKSFIAIALLSTKHGFRTTNYVSRRAQQNNKHSPQASQLYSALHNVATDSIRFEITAANDDLLVLLALTQDCLYLYGRPYISPQNE